MRRTAALGRAGEDLAAEHLRSLGYEVIDRNWRCREGELDLIAIDDGVLVACEVKTRRSVRFGSPIEAVTPTKLLRLRGLAQAYLAAHDVAVRGVRIDVVGILALPGAQVRVTHLRGVS
jgi:putative endonuclease